MMRAALLLLMPALAFAQDTSVYGTNFTALLIRDEAKFVTNPPPREPTREQVLLAEAVKLIDLARIALDPSKPAGQRNTASRTFMDQTDPVPRPVNLDAQPSP